jgi:hypothetical protein
VIEKRHFAARSGFRFDRHRERLIQDSLFSLETSHTLKDIGAQQGCRIMPRNSAGTDMVRSSMKVLQAAKMTTRGFLRWRFGVFILLAHTLFASAAIPSKPDLSAQFLAAVDKVEAARKGSAAAAPQAQAAFRKLVAADPQSPLYLAYFGSTFALQAHYDGAPWKQMSLVHKSIAKINKALSMLRPEDDQEQNRGIPVSLETRLAAVATFDALPKSFGTMPVAKQQLALAMNSPLFASAPAELRARFQYEVAYIAGVEGNTQEERVALHQVLQLAPASLDLNAIRARLAKLGG